MRTFTQLYMVPRRSGELCTHVWIWVLQKSWVRHLLLLWQHIARLFYKIKFIRPSIQ